MYGHRRAQLIVRNTDIYMALCACNKHKRRPFITAHSNYYSRLLLECKQIITRDGDHRRCRCRKRDQTQHLLHAALEADICSVCSKLLSFAGHIHDNIYTSERCLSCIINVFERLATHALLWVITSFHTTYLLFSL